MLDSSSTGRCYPSRKTKQRSYQTNANDSAETNKVEPLQLPDMLKAHKKTTPELKMDKVETKTEAKSEGQDQGRGLAQN